MDKIIASVSSVGARLTLKLTSPSEVSYTARTRDYTRWNLKAYHLRARGARVTERG